VTKLQKYFQIYNKKYFGGALPPVTLRWADMKHFGHYFAREHEMFDIFTNEVVSVRTEHVIELGKWSTNNRSVWRMTLLHEMCHLKLRDKKRAASHGRLFNQEMKRLAASGAFHGLW
jgi:hypothetical protein